MVEAPPARSVSGVVTRPLRSIGGQPCSDRLQDDLGGQVDSVTYSARDGAAVDRFVRFHR